MRKFQIIILALAAGGIVLLGYNFYSAKKKLLPVIHSSAKNNPEEKGERTEALEGMQWMNRARAYPNADIPANAYASAMNQYNARFGNQQTSTVGSWTSIGPNNVGGRTLCVAIDPVDTNKIWLGSAGGGLWKSTVGGLGTNAWTYVPIGFPVVGVST